MLCEERCNSGETPVSKQRKTPPHLYQVQRRFFCQGSVDMVLTNFLTQIPRNVRDAVNVAAKAISS